MTRTSAPSPSLLTAAELSRLGGLMFVARRLVEGLYAGRHRSPRRGHSTEFHDFRPYLPGDEPRRVDWAVFGRTDRLFVRRFRHEAELAVHLLIDRSASMDFTGAGDGQGDDRAAVSKWTYARQIAAALSLLAVRQADRVGLAAFDERCKPLAPLAGGWAHFQQLLAALESAEIARQTDPVAALHQAHAMWFGRRRQRGLLVLISDLLDEPAAWLEGLQPFRHSRFDVMVLQVLTPGELDLAGVGSARLIDAETGAAARTHAPRIRDRYRREMQRHLDTLHRGLLARGIDHQLALTSQPPLTVLQQFVTRRGREAPHR